MVTRFAGIDIGSRTIELVVLDEDGNLKEKSRADTGYDPMDTAERMISGKYDVITATGYGRGMFEITFKAPTITEIKAHALGAWMSHPGATTVIDIGGQDNKAISLFEDGRVRKFEMNDRCAAGTGKFLEIMAKTLGYSIEEFGPAAMTAEREIRISSMCTVFAESEVTSLIAKQESRDVIARAVHSAVVNRTAGMISRISNTGDILFTGGVAQNPCITEMLSEKLKRRVIVPPDPQYAGAYGAALISAGLIKELKAR